MELFEFIANVDAVDKDDNGSEYIKNVNMEITTTKVETIVNNIRFSRRYLWQRLSRKVVVDTTTIEFMYSR
jgi:hypothetical protein